MDLIPLKLSVTTCYLIKTDEKYLLIDSGYEQDWELFQSRLDEANVKFSEIGYLLLTHHHDDHCGLVHKILYKNNSIRVVMLDKCNELIQKGENDQTHGGGLLNKRIAFLMRYKQAYVSIVLRKKVDKSKNLKFQPYSLRDIDIVFDGEPNLRELGIPVDGKIIKTPGHTVDSISVLFPNGDCLVGDAAAHMLSFAGTHYCVIFICNMDEYYNSWEKMIAAGAKRILPAHGLPFSVNKLIKNMRKNKSKHLVGFDYNN